MKAFSSAKASDVPDQKSLGRAVLEHDRRHLRRCRIDLEDGRKLLVDLPETVALEADDVLLVEGGGYVEIVPGEEPLYEVTARDPVHLIELAWHIGNRHLPAEIRDGRILILRDHVIRAMLEGLGAGVKDVVAPFSPVRGAYSGHGGHSHGGHGHGGHAHDGGAEPLRYEYQLAAGAAPGAG